MSDEMQFIQLTPGRFFSAGLAYRPPAARERNLGAAIFLVAIADYRGLNDEDHEDAKAFLYPQEPEWRNHYDWAVSISEGLNPAWLRNMLNRSKSRWDRERSRRMMWHTRTSLPRGKSNVANNSRVDGIAVQPAGTPGNAWGGDTAARI